MIAKTTQSEQVWQAPDGKKTIWKVTLEADGKQYPVQTFSEKIAQVGFNGDVESYKSARGDTFVKQVAKQQGGGYGGGKPAQPRADAAIKAQFAIKAAIQYAATQGMGTSTEDVEGYAREFFLMVERVKATATDSPVQAQQKQMGTYAQDTINPNNIPF